MISVLIFSKDRPMQLDLLLRSMPAMMSNITVLYRGDQNDYTADVALVREHDFHDDTMRILRAIRTPYLMMLTDDTVFTTAFDVSSVCAALAEHPRSLVFSLRLGRNTSWCYMSGSSQSAEFIEHGPALLEWPIRSASGDFAYPFDLSSSVYRTSDIIARATTLGRFRNPNELEAWLSRQQWHADATMLSFGRSVAVSIPMNVTQELWTNKHGGDHSTSVQTLLQRWRDGWRFAMPDPKLKTSSAHECIPLHQERRKR